MDTNKGIYVNEFNKEIKNLQYEYVQIKYFMLICVISATSSLKGKKLRNY